MDVSSTDGMLAARHYRFPKGLRTEDPLVADEPVEALRLGLTSLHDIVIPPHPGLSFDKAEFVMDVLSLYRLIEGYKRQHPEDQEAMTNRLGQFQGFDEDQEHFEQLFTRHVLEQQRKFPEQRAYRGNMGFTSAEPMRADYKRMLHTWRELGSPIELTSDHVRALLA